MNKYGLVMPLYVGPGQRTDFKCTMDSLIRTLPLNTTKLPFFITFKESPDWSDVDFAPYLGFQFEFIILDDHGNDVNTRDMFLANSLFDYTDSTHVIFLYSDFTFNRYWLFELDRLVHRHPDAMAWSVYRSAYTRHHRILHTSSNGDVSMTMHDGLGCLSREEWKEYKKTINGDFTCPIAMGGGCTIDIHHSYKRPGPYWATGRDYWQNMRPHPGIEAVDRAIDFVGADYEPS